jgi:hypothetical protein
MDHSPKQQSTYQRSRRKVMSNPIITQIVEQVHDLPDDLQQQVLTFISTLRQEHLQESGNAWDVLESLTGTIEAPADWSAEHDHYLYGTPKRQETDSRSAILPKHATVRGRGTLAKMRSLVVLA